MIYTPMNNKWFYSYIDIPNLNEIKQELINLKNSDAPRHSTTHNYFNIKKSVAIQQCPRLAEYLDSISATDKLLQLLFSSISPIKSLPHVDIGIMQSLNIPLINCDNSYTVWYKTPKHSFDAHKSGAYASLNLDEVDEIKRVEYTTRPILVNTTILHNGVAESYDRTICGLRFYPHLTPINFNKMNISVPLTQLD